jgi:hypothetical protein
MICCQYCIIFGKSLYLHRHYSTSFKPFCSQSVLHTQLTSLASAFTEYFTWCIPFRNSVRTSYEKNRPNKTRRTEGIHQKPEWDPNPRPQSRRGHSQPLDRVAKVTGTFVCPMEILTLQVVCSHNIQLVVLVYSSTVLHNSVSFLALKG